MSTRSLLPVMLLLGMFVFPADSFLFSPFSSLKRNCIIKPWTEWGLCQSTRKGIIQVRSRKNVPPRNGGRPCPRNVFEEKSCNSADVTSTLIRATIGSLGTAKSSAAKRPSLARNPASRPRGARNQNKTASNVKGDTCNVLRDPSSGKILAGGNCKSTRSRTFRSIKESLTSYLSRFRRQVIDPKTDILFLIDRSGSIGNQNIQKMRDMAAGLINLFPNIELGITRIGVVTFNSNYEPRIPFDHFIQANQKKQLMDAIQALTFTSFGKTYLGQALRKARTNTLFDIGWGARASGGGVKKMIFLISDGCSNDPDVKIADEAPFLQANDIDIFVVQVGTNEFCKQEMLLLDGGEFTCFNLFFYSNWISFCDAASNFLSLQTYSSNTNLISSQC